MVSTLHAGPFFGSSEHYQHTLNAQKTVGKHSPPPGQNYHHATWRGITDIWGAKDTTPLRSNTDGDMRLPGPKTSDSFAKLQQSDTYGSDAMRDNSSVVNNATETSSNTSTFQTSFIPTNSRSSIAPISPSRDRNQEGRNAGTNESMGTLSNAALLTGSAPDVEPSTSDPRLSSRRDMESRFRGLSVAEVKDFAPNLTQLQYHHGEREGRHNGNNTYNFAPVPNAHVDRSITRLHADSVPFVPREQTSFTPNGWHPSRFDASNLTRGNHLDNANFDLAYWHIGQRNFKQPSQLHSDLSTGAIVNTKDAMVSFPARNFSQMNDKQIGVDSIHQSPLQNHEIHAPIPSVSGLGIHRQLKPGHFSDSRASSITSHREDTTASSTDASGTFTPGLTSAPASRSNSGSGASGLAYSTHYDTNQRTFDGDRPVLAYRSQINGGHSLPPTYDFAPSHVHGFPYGPGRFDPYHGRTLHPHGPSYQQLSLRSQPPEKPASALLRDYRLTMKSSRKWELKDVYHHIVEFSGDQHGSRFIQCKLETATSEEKDQVFAEIHPEIIQLMQDIFGNYVIQKLFEHCTQAQKSVMAECMKGHVLKLALNQYACRVVQKALDHVLTDQQANMVREMRGHILSIIESQHGNHVIQKTIEAVPSEHIQFVMDEQKGNILALAKHKYGCRVVQRVLEHGTVAVKRSVLAELETNIPSLIHDEFGNFVVSHIIERGEPVDRYRMVVMVQQQLLFYSRNKYASNVVENAMKFAVEKQRQEILATLTGRDGRLPSPVYELMKDQFGNYVIQTVLKLLDGRSLAQFITELSDYVIRLDHCEPPRRYEKQSKAIKEAIGDAVERLPKTGYGPATVKEHMTSKRPGVKPKFGQMPSDSMQFLQSKAY